MQIVARWTRGLYRYPGRKKGGGGLYFTIFRSLVVSFLRILCFIRRCCCRCCSIDNNTPSREHFPCKVYTYPRNSSLNIRDTLTATGESRSVIESLSLRPNKKICISNLSRHQPSHPALLLCVSFFSFFLSFFASFSFHSTASLPRQRHPSRAESFVYIPDEDVYASTATDVHTEE